MICDNISNIARYKNDKDLYTVLSALKSFLNGEPYESNLISKIVKKEFATKLLEEAELENHHKYIDVHYVVRGSEKILVNSNADLVRLTEFSEEKDCEMFAVSGDETSIVLREGDFLFVYPGESHAPLLTVEDENIEKVIIKMLDTTKEHK